ncbi:MAG: LCP family protein [Patescibacteria group bacterium]|nr:LCP family protein [Patescibacteria group bacterium]
MKKYNTNLIDKNDLSSVRREYKKSRFVFIIKNVLFLFLIGFLSTILALSVIASSSKSNLAKTIQKNSLIKQISSLISSDFRKLKGELEMRTNVLILGMGGEGHDGPLLTDTIILLSYNYSNNEIFMTSIPRDLIVKTENGMYKKINHLYSIGEANKKDGGLEYTKTNIESNIGIPIHYAVSVDFYGFKEIVDALGGVDVNIDNSFIDYQYPTKNHKVQTIQFTKGLHHLSGEEALQYSRSRHGIVIDGEGFEGSDYARSQRQMKIINSVKDRVLSFSTITNPTKISKLFKILNEYIETDVESWEAIRFVDILKQIDKTKIYNKIINDAPDNLLVSTTSTYDGAWILIPKNGNYGIVQDFFNNLFENQRTQNNTQQNNQENAIIYVLNGTKQTGLANKKAGILEMQGLKIAKVENAPTQNSTSTIIYDLSENKFPQTLKKIQEKISGIRTNTLPENLKDYLIEGNLDFIILLGNDQK